MSGGVWDSCLCQRAEAVVTISNVFARFRTRTLDMSGRTCVHCGVGTYRRRRGALGSRVPKGEPDGRCTECGTTVYLSAQVPISRTRWRSA